MSVNWKNWISNGEFYRIFLLLFLSRWFRKFSLYSTKSKTFSLFFFFIPRILSVNKINNLIPGFTPPLFQQSQLKNFLSSIHFRKSFIIVATLFVENFWVPPQIFRKTQRIPSFFHLLEDSGDLAESQKKILKTILKIQEKLVKISYKNQENKFSVNFINI